MGEQWEKLRERQIDSRVLYEGASYSFTLDEVILPNGTPRIREHLHHPGGVAILAMNERDEIAMVAQYRHPIGEVMLEIPAGKLDKLPGETPEAAALRELREETGFTAEKLEPLGFVYPSPGVMDEKLWLFSASRLSANHQELDDDEFLAVQWVPRAKLRQAIADGTITDIKTICAWTRANLKD